MKILDIVEVMCSAVDDTIFKQWKHEGYIDFMNSDGFRVVIDGKRYLVRIEENAVKEG